jgi:hypothetical protein
MTSTMPKNIQFRMETLFTGKNGRVGVIKPDSNGIYKGLPMMVLNQTTQQKTYYEPESMMKAITNPEGTFYKNYVAHKAYGELGHPRFTGMDKDAALARLMDVQEARASHLFTGIYTDAPASDGTIVLRADIKPAGEKGATLKESLDDPIQNTAFSLRAFVSGQMLPDGRTFRTVHAFTTFDAVLASGYATTDKFHAIGLESMGNGVDDFHEYEIDITSDGKLLIDAVALESLADSELAEILGTNTVGRVVRTRTLIDPDSGLLARHGDRYARSLFHDHFKGL